ncbi:properdin-like [Lampris incognitus]|uniref:properdin-like n=1 Tax=Lampris incognitus TaxID=2546036 RepID=UPI0024B4D36A|nr:properdin-like [Lampris incognitus]
MKVWRWTVLVLLGCVQRSECGRCYSRYVVDFGQCEEELGEIDEEDECCQNPNYGYQGDDQVCRSCGPPTWSLWSSWSSCSVLCGEGVRQRTRQCSSVDQTQCPDHKNIMQTEPCTTDRCCTAMSEWEAWGPWGPCSVSCGGGQGVRRRERGFPHQGTGCDDARVGARDQTEPCRSEQPCPVHGGWSDWSGWGACSASCIPEKPSGDLSGAVVYPIRRQHRFCTNPAPSSDTSTPGNSCQGDGTNVQSCSDLPNCPVDGNWGAWGPWGPCSVSCGEGILLSIRTCNHPLPKYGGRLCDGSTTKTTVCKSTCPVHGVWTGWSSWGQCSTSCIPEGRASVRTRHRSCSNPAPSSDPPGRSCPEATTEAEPCDHLPHCPVDGNWSPWGAFSSCSVSCGVGLELSVRQCNNPTPKHGGRPCVGTGGQKRICKTKIHCPVNGLWSEWSSWGACQSPIQGRDIHCKTSGGSQTRERRCLYRAHNGAICPGYHLTDRRVCYDVNRCYFKGSWNGWEEWSFCNPACGQNSKRYRKRICEPDLSHYRTHISRLREKATFFGTPLSDCGSVPDGEKKIEIQDCLNVPPCLD